MGIGITPLSSLSLRLAIFAYLSIYMSIYISTHILSLSPLIVVPGFNRNTIKTLSLHYHKINTCLPTTTFRYIGTPHCPLLKYEYQLLVTDKPNRFSQVVKKDKMLTTRDPRKMLKKPLMTQVNLSSLTYLVRVPIRIMPVLYLKLHLSQSITSN